MNNPLESLTYGQLRDIYEGESFKFDPITKHAVLAEMNKREMESAKQHLRHPAGLHSSLTGTGVPFHA